MPNLSPESSDVPSAPARTAAEVAAPVRPRRRRRWIRLAVALLVLYVLATVLAAFLATHPRGLRPFVRFVDLAPVEAGETVEIVTADGVRLSGSVAAPASPKGVVLMFHGIGARRFVGGAQRVRSWGYAAAAFDFRAHGASEGSITTVGWEERRDVEAIEAYARTRWPGLKIGAWGASMGGAAVTYSESAPRFDAVVLESVYAALDTAFERRVEHFGARWMKPFARPTYELSQLWCGVDGALLRPVDHMGKLRPERVLITTGAEDPFATVDDLRLLAAGAPGCRTLVVPNAVHHDVWMMGGDDYFAEVRRFFDERLP
ncbi:MAG TPA: alpha/beta hydrolase [Planctomycetota bacterium]|nr:alpha/beta hydrolase [Planctomycetota bacterium]